MLHLGICDDLQGDRNLVEKLIKDYCMKDDYNFNVITFESGEALVNYYIDGKAPFDIVFLDIYMGGENGLKTAELIRNYDATCKIIFTTSSAEHALESFKVFPFHYLTKPLTNVIFDPVFEKAISTIDKEKRKRLTLKVGASLQTIFYKDLLFIESNARLLKIHTVENEILSCYSKLDAVENQLNDGRFLRCHKSFLVNMDYIMNVENYSFKLIDNTQISISQRDVSNIKKAFFAYVMNKVNQI